jgi:lysine decarboxylase/arginine decarboxylase
MIWVHPSHPNDYPFSPSSRDLMNPEELLSVLIVGGDTRPESPETLLMKGLVAELEGYGLSVTRISDVYGLKFGPSGFGSGYDCIILDSGSEGVGELMADIRAGEDLVPIFLVIDPGVVETLPLSVIREVNEYIWLLDDSPEFIAGRVDAAARRYRGTLLPPMFRALVDYSRDCEYSWHTPGHTGGTAFLKSPAGRLFLRFYGDELLRSDLSVSVTELGSLLNHTGPIGDAERYASKVFGSDLTYFVTNGTSMSNRIIHTATVTEGDLVLIDRNCHASIEQSVTMTRSIPVYMIPTRNRYGIIGPIPPSEMEAGTIMKKITACPLISLNTSRPALAVVTNSTYDGLCYDTVTLEGLLGGSVDRIHYDEAWYGYAGFNRIYQNRFAMRTPLPQDRGDIPTVFATQSTHKLLAALSQASMLHIRQGRSPIDPLLFNVSYRMHASTSPLYPIIASLDVSSKMMDGSSGRALSQEAIDEAIRFRRSMARIRREVLSDDPDGWWFSVWQPESVRIPDSDEALPFEEVPPSILGSDPLCWVLHPDERWHGFSDLPDGWCMLDPIKVTVLTPGINDDGSLAECGIPAALVVLFLQTRGIINEKAGEYNILFLFSMGVTKGKWGTLVSEFFEFKRFYDAHAPLELVFPDLVSQYPDRYTGMTLPDLSLEMHRMIASHRLTERGNKACSEIPLPVMTPSEAFSHLASGKVELIPLREMEGRIAATGVVPYPPGIPILMPGESAGEMDGPVLSYLRVLEEYDRTFPGFSHTLHGIERVDGHYCVYCVRE